MAKLLNNEYSMVSFKTYKEGKKEKRSTFITVLLNIVLLRGIAGGGTKEFEFTEIIFQELFESSGTSSKFGVRSLLKLKVRATVVAFFILSSISSIPLALIKIIRTSSIFVVRTLINPMSFK